MSGTKTSSIRTAIAFFVLAFVLSWGILLAEAAAVRGWFPFRLPQPLLVVSGFGPALAALIVAFWQDGHSGMGQLLARLGRWRVRWYWYLVALFAPATFFLSAVALATRTGFIPHFSEAAAVEIAHSQGLSPWLLVPVLFALLFVLSLGEEIGWRGFALPTLLSWGDPLVASTMLGIAWGLWHLPLIWVPALGAAVGNVPFVWFLVDITAMSILFTWLFQHTEGSLLIATLLHSGNNTAAALVPLLPPVAEDLRPFFFNIALKWLAIGVILMISGTKLIGQRRAPTDEERLIPYLKRIRQTISVSRRTQS